MNAPKSDPRAKEHLRAVLKEYLVTDERVAEEKLLDLLVDAVIKPTNEQPLVVQLHVEGTHARGLMRWSDLTQDDRDFLAQVDDFRTELT